MDSGSTGDRPRDGGASTPSPASGGGDTPDVWRTRETLLARLHDRGDARSWEEFARIYQPYIFAVVRNMNVAHHDCEDLTQEVLCKAWEILPTFQYRREKGSFRGWFARITRNVVLNFITKGKRRRELLEDKRLDLPSGSTEAISLPEVEKIAEEEWRVYLGRMAWDNVKPTLNEVTRNVFEGVIAGKEIEQIAGDLGVAENTVYRYRKNVQNLLYREIRRLEAELG